VTGSDDVEYHTRRRGEKPPLMRERAVFAGISMTSAVSVVAFPFSGGAGKADIFRHPIS